MVTVPDNQILRAATYIGKGGVGKTTTTAYSGVAAAHDHDLDVVLMDLAGKQNDLSAQFGLTEEITTTDEQGNKVIDVDKPISAIFGPNWSDLEAMLDDVVSPLVYETEEGVDLIPSDAGLGGADNNLASINVEDRYTILDDFITNHLRPRYDLVLLDLPGKEDNIALNGLFAAENVITPLKPGEFEKNQLDQLRADLDGIRARHPVDPELAMVLTTMYDQRNSMDEEFAASLREEYPEEAAPAKVSVSQAVSKAQGRGETLFAVPEDELSETGERVVEAYRANTSELLERL